MFQSPKTHESIVKLKKQSNKDSKLIFNEIF